MHPQVQSQLIWGIKDKLKKYCSVNDMKELLIANKQEVPSGESNVRDGCFWLFLLPLQFVTSVFPDCNMFLALKAT